MFQPQKYANQRKKVGPNFLETFDYLSQQGHYSENVYTCLTVAITLEATAVTGGVQAGMIVEFGYKGRDLESLTAGQIPPFALRWPRPLS